MKTFYYKFIFTLAAYFFKLKDGYNSSSFYMDLFFSFCQHTSNYWLKTDTWKLLVQNLFFVIAQISKCLFEYGSRIVCFCLNFFSKIFVLSISFLFGKGKKFFKILIITWKLNQEERLEQTTETNKQRKLKKVNKFKLNFDSKSEENLTDDDPILMKLKTKLLLEEYKNNKNQMSLSSVLEKTKLTEKQVKKFIYNAKESEKKKKGIDTEKKIILYEFYKKNPFPNSSEIQDLQIKLSLNEIQIKNWFKKIRLNKKRTI